MYFLNTVYKNFVPFYHNCWDFFTLNSLYQSFVSRLFASSFQENNFAIVILNNYHCKRKEIHAGF